MENVEFIEFEKTRDFSNKLNTTFSFIKQNFKGLFKSILFIAGPPILVAGLLVTNFMTDFFKLSFQASGDPGLLASYFTSVSFWLQLLSMMVFLITGMVTSISTTNNYLILYREKKTNRIEVSEVWERVRDTFGMYLGTTVLFTLLAITVYLLMIIPVVILGSISPFLIFFGVLILMGVIIYLSISVSLVFAVRAFEKKGFIGALRRSYFLVLNKWWSTFGLVMLLSLMVGVVSYVFLIPAYVIMIVNSLHNVEANNFQDPSSSFGPAFTVLMTLYYLSQMVLSCFPNIGLAFQYFNLVEMKEAKGLLGEIETLGSGPASPAQEEHY